MHIISGRMKEGVKLDGRTGDKRERMQGKCIVEGEKANADAIMNQTISLIPNQCCGNIPPSTATILFVTYPVLTIHRIVSAISSGRPNLPSGISGTREEKTISYLHRFAMVGIEKRALLWFMRKG